MRQEKALDDIVNDDSITHNDVSDSPIIERKQHGYLIRLDYSRNIGFLSLELDKKKWEIVEDALEHYFELHKDALAKYKIS